MSNHQAKPPYFISSVSIKGLFARYDLDWQLSDVNVLVGKNGSGKSTILKIIDFCMSSPSHGMDKREIRSIANKFRSVEVKLNNGVGFKVDVEKEGTAKRDMGELVRELMKSDDFKSFAEENYKGKIPIDELIEALEREPVELEEERYKISGGNTLKDSGGGIGEYINFERISTFDMLLLSKKEYDEHSKSCYSQLDFLLKKEMERLKGLIILRSGGVSGKLSKNSSSRKYGSIKRAEFKGISTFVDVVNSLFSSEGKEFSIRPNGDLGILMGNEEVSCEDLSSGEKQMLIILMKAINSSAKPAIILCDEPELSLHLSWQERLIESIRKINPLCQLVIVSHSPAIVMKGWMSSMTEIGSLKREARQDG